MARRNTKEEKFASPYTPERQLEHGSGWCMTGHHEGCKYQFDHGKCGCTCHTQKTQKPKEKVVIVADSDDPRPWRKNG